METTSKSPDGTLPSPGPSSSDKLVKEILNKINTLKGKLQSPDCTDRSDTEDELKGCQNEFAELMERESCARSSPKKPPMNRVSFADTTTATISETLSVEFENNLSLSSGDDAYQSAMEQVYHEFDDKYSKIARENLDVSKSHYKLGKETNNTVNETYDAVKLLLQMAKERERKEEEKKKRKVMRKAMSIMKNREKKEKSEEKTEKKKEKKTEKNKALRTSSLSQHVNRKKGTTVPKGPSCLDKKQDRQKAKKKEPKENLPRFRFG
jgi:hypothetical protein